MKNSLAFLAIFLTLALFGYVIEVEKITRGQAPSILPFTHLEQKIEQKNIEQIVVVEKTSIKPEINSFQVPILVYHNVFQYFPGESEEKKKYDVEPLAFEQQMQFLLKNGYQSISFNDLTEHLLNGQAIPEKSFVINFDDGRESQYENAFPILKKYNLTATFFVYTNPIDHDKTFMTWPEIKELDAAGMTIGGHTKTHPFLVKITDGQELRKEIEDGKKILEEKLGKLVNFFAYPFYQYSNDVVAMVKEIGFKAARGGYRYGTNSAENIFTLGAIQISNDMNDFILRICHTMPKEKQLPECQSKS